RSTPRHCARTRRRTIPASTAPAAPPEPRVAAPAHALLRRLRLLRLLADQHGVRHHPCLGADLLLDSRRHLRMVAQKLLGVLAALADALAVVAEPGPGLLDDAGLHAEVD